MPLYRKLHTKIIDSFDFAEMPDDFTRVFWMLLIVVADSEGRAIDNPNWIRSKMFPLRPDVKDQQIENALSWLAGRNMVIRYQVDNHKYFCVTNFKKYQTGTNKEADSIFPGHENLVQSNSEPTQELVQSNSASYTYTYTDANSNAVGVDTLDGDFLSEPDEELPFEKPSKKARKPKADKRPRQPKPPAPYMDDHHVIIYREMCHVTPNEVQRKLIAETVNDSGIWRKTLSGWMARGYNPRNVQGMLEVFAKGGNLNGGAPPKQEDKPVNPYAQVMDGSSALAYLQEHGGQMDRLGF